MSRSSRYLAALSFRRRSSFRCAPSSPGRYTSRKPVAQSGLWHLRFRDSSASLTGHDPGGTGEGIETERLRFRPQALTPERGKNATGRTLDGTDGPGSEERRPRRHPAPAAARLDLSVSLDGAGLVESVSGDCRRPCLLRKRGDCLLGRSATENQTAVQAREIPFESGETAVQPPARGTAETAVAGFLVLNENRNDPAAR